MARELWKRGLPYALIKEFRNSKLCNKCHHPVQSFKQSPKHVEDHIQTYDLNGLTEPQTSNLRKKFATPWGLRVCNSCSTIWCRDKNACLNMRRLFMHYVLGLSSLSCYIRA
mmetsp:Transcript_33972/g.61315  ORF Transcript_33972/g.61315 Transcript_33972/m.61315 type:complete len:112 (-) Transcript_33972:293-628(-)